MTAKPASIVFAIALLAQAFAAPPAPAGAQESTPALRASVVVQGGLVTLGDLFENAGAAATTPVFRAPDPGETGHVSAARIAEAARRNGLEWRNEKATAQVAVRRDSTRIGLDEIRDRIAEAVRARLALAPGEHIALTLARTSRALHLPTDLNGAVRVAHLDLSARGGEFTAELTPEGEIASSVRAVYRGTATVTMRLPVLSDTVSRGETISSGMVQMREVPRDRIPPDAVLAVEELAGMAARRNLHPGQALRADDIQPPRLVRRNGAVTITYVQGALNISMQGRSLDDGARNDLVRVLNLRSKRTIEAFVTGPDQATVIAAGPARTALLGANAPKPR